MFEYGSCRLEEQEGRGFRCVAAPSISRVPYARVLRDLGVNCAQVVERELGQALVSGDAEEDPQLLGGDVQVVGDPLGALSVSRRDSSSGSCVAMPTGHLPELHALNL